MTTEEKTYTTQDKSDWGAGPWQEEFDKIQFVDADTGLPCLIVRGPSGALCGYVGVSEGHPYFGVDYNAYTNAKCLCEGEHDELSNLCPSCPENSLHVHGGITYSDYCAEDGAEDTSICHIPAPGEPDRVFWFGFDCAHAGDVTPAYNRGYNSGYQPLYRMETYRTVDYVRAECAGLAAQLEAM